MAVGEYVTPGFNHEIPEAILTPDRVETRLGTLEFFDGMPSEATVEKVYENLDLMRGVETFLSGIPAASLEALRRGCAAMGADAYNRALIFDELMDSNPLFLTGNTDTVYCIAFLDLQADGAMVIEIPPKCGPSTVDDAYFRFVIDMGLPGPDRGAGGKYLILPPDDESGLDPPLEGMEADVDGEHYYVAKSTSYVNLVILRGLLVDGKPDAPTATFRDGVKIYPRSKAQNAPAMEFISGSRQTQNTIHANNIEFYDELHAVIDREPLSMLDLELRGLFATIGVEKGKEFAPDDRMRRILTEAVAIGNATARSIAFRPRLDGAYYYPNSAWATAFPGFSHEWIRDDGNGGRNIDSRTLFFYIATVNTPAMVWKLPGIGSQYAYAAVDSNGDYLDGSKNYTLHIPADVPAANFWSVVVYDPQTRSELQTSQPYPSKNDKRDALIQNADGSFDLTFGPEAPKTGEANWTQTVPGKGWFTLFRLYGPLEPWFEQTWRPGEITPT